MDIDRSNRRSDTPTILNMEAMVKLSARNAMNELPHEYTNGSLRSRLVAKLTGLSVATLQHWHASTLQIASQQPGERGTPRLYSWVDYQRLCVMASLKDQDVPATRIRQAIPFLDVMFPGWWDLSLCAYRGAVLGSPSSMHIAVRQGMDIIVDVPGAQTSFRELLGAEALDTSKEMKEALSTIQHAGPLFRKHAFGDAISMRPELNAAQPTLLGTALETSFILGLKASLGEKEIARVYRIEDWMVARAIEFEEAA